MRDAASLSLEVTLSLRYLAGQNALLWSVEHHPPPHSHLNCISRFIDDLLHVLELVVLDGSQNEYNRTYKTLR